MNTELFKLFLIAILLVYICCVVIYTSIVLYNWLECQGILKEVDIVIIEYVE